jgi:uncharacterized membrane protein YccF (DUF307 family)
VIVGALGDVGDGHDQSLPDPERQGTGRRRNLHPAGIPSARLFRRGRNRHDGPKREISQLRTLGNILWHFPFFGFVSAAFYWLLGLLLTLLVVTAPIGLGLMEYGKFLLAPFGHAMVSKSDLQMTQNPLWRTYSALVMLIYLPFGLLFTVVSIIHVVTACLGIVTIPVALVVAKSLGTVLNPVNKICVPTAVADEIERRNGMAAADRYAGRS